MAKIENISESESSGSAEEESWKASLDGLKKQMTVYQNVSKKEDHRATEAEAQKVVAAMRNVGDSHTDPRVKKEWHEKAVKFSKANASERVTLFDDIGKGLLILLATPFALAGAVIFGAGAIVYGVGMLVKGLGNVLTGGFLTRDETETKDKD
jgi:hypothetical protein